jgi:hypothetical protein
MTKKYRVFVFLLSMVFFSLPGHSSAITIPTGLTIEKTLSPGEAAQGRIEIINPDEEEVTVRIYQTDYMFYSDGTSEFAKPGGVARSNASWITYAPDRLVIPPRGRSEVSYRISAPNDPDLKGTYWSVIMVEPLAKGALEPPSPEKGKVKLGVQAVFRHAVQMVTHIGDTGKSAMEFGDKRLEKAEGHVFLVLDVKNTGERWLVPALYLDLYDGSGRALGRFEGGRLRIFPGCSVRYRVSLGGLRLGKYNALVMLDAGEGQIFGAKYTLEVK